MYKLITAPTSEPVSSTELKSQLRITGTDQDTMLDLLISAARQHVEDYLRMQLNTATWILYLDEFPKSGECIYIQKSPVTSVTSVKYLESVNGTETTLVANTDYVVDIISKPCRIYEAYGKTWPTPRDIRNSVYIQFVAGYSSDYKIYSEQYKIIKQAILMVAATMYENPIDETSGTITQQFDLNSLHFLRPLRLLKY
jgi:uncharacterized phiE125 gp8 family phage protein